ncbi:hypothetical protein FK178_13310 [Antarcticibacterium arcticum]|uniref:Uncharacterized protein n=1 Tax=Antarcticibacterium arcticum TaxID=2585771 RepID=A0A5B8YM96_9FLAO|nr:hypothetical protein [Antarcticibacterium arcticum]QED38631.1 hypothetical protein FK178_13310 [Antarcticibacterium arcticum]
MAIIGNIINEGPGHVNVRSGEVLADIVTAKDFFQIRTYAMGDNDRKNGSKQNIQLTKEKAIELRRLLDKFIG